MAPTDLGRCGDSVRPAGEHDVHQYEVWQLGRRELDRVGRLGGHAYHVVAEPLEPALEIECNDPFVLDDEDAILFHYSCQYTDFSLDVQYRK